MANRIGQDLPRLPSGVPGLETLLKGGFLCGGMYMLIGRPGAGKTILGNQICFNHVAKGGRAIYVTLLTESHARLLASLQQMSFFDGRQVANSLTYLSAYQALEGEGLDGLLRLLSLSIKKHEATLLVVDGLVTAASDLALKKFIHDLQMLVEFLGCTTLLLTGAKDVDSNYPERTMVDGLLQLTATRSGMRVVRQIEVLKHRGSNAILGAHFFDISQDGIAIHPRSEAILGRAEHPEKGGAPLPTGISSLDRMLYGGVQAGSTTLLLGSPGSGKTLVGSSFLHAGAAAGEQALYFGFYEPPDRLVAKAKRVGLPLDAAIAAGSLEVVWQPPLEQVADALAERLLNIVRTRKVQRLFIDGLSGFERALVHEGRASEFFTALSNELRALGVTTIVSEGMKDFVGSDIEIVVPGVSGIADNLILLRYVELRSQLRRLVSIRKVREGRYDSSAREFIIDHRGVRVASTEKSAASVLSGGSVQMEGRTTQAPAKRAPAKSKRTGPGRRP